MTRTVGRIQSRVMAFTSGIFRPHIYVNKKTKAVCIDEDSLRIHCVSSSVFLFIFRRVAKIFRWGLIYGKMPPDIGCCLNASISLLSMLIYAVVQIIQCENGRRSSDEVSMIDIRHSCLVVLVIHYGN